jgi:aldose 1-epimerase
MLKRLIPTLLCAGLLVTVVSCNTKKNSSAPSSPESEDIDDGRELIEDQLYTDSGLTVYFDKVGAKIKKIEYNTIQIARDGDIKGRFANRIGDAQFTLNGTTYDLDKNDGNNHLHGGKAGFGTKEWTKVGQTPSTITYSYHSVDGEMGYPGNLDITVKYTLRQNGELMMEYFAKSDADTIFNPTNHIWLNLNGPVGLTNHTLWLDADKYTETDSELIPTGNILSVAGTKYDFREEKEFDRANKYDDNFVLNGEGYRKVARLTGEDLGVVLEISTDRPGFQIYNDTNWIVMETQLFPDAPNHENFPSAVLKADTDFYSKSAYHFIVPEE